MEINPVRDEILAGMDAGWDSLQETVGRLEPERLTGLADAQGWTAQDHFEHLAAWERSMVFLLQGMPRHEGLGVDEATYLDHDFDAINAAIRENTPDRTLAETLDHLRSVHEQLRALVAGMTADDLAQPYVHFLPDEPGQSDSRPISNRLRGNTDEHFHEHLGYIEVLASQPDSRA